MTFSFFTALAAGSRRRGHGSGVTAPAPSAAARLLSLRNCQVSPDHVLCLPARERAADAGPRAGEHKAPNPREFHVLPSGRQRSTSRYVSQNINLRLLSHTCPAFLPARLLPLCRVTASGRPQKVTAQVSTARWSCPSTERAHAPLLHVQGVQGGQGGESWRHLLSRLLIPASGGQFPYLLLRAQQCPGGQYLPVNTVLASRLTPGVQPPGTLPLRVLLDIGHVSGQDFLSQWLL